MFIKELFKHWTYQVFAPGTLLRQKYNAFRDLLKFDDVALDVIAELEEIYHGERQADYSRVVWLGERLSDAVRRMIDQLTTMAPARYMGLSDYHRKIDFYIKMALDQPHPDVLPPYIVPLREAAQMPELAGGKAANLARIAVETDLPVPDGFVVTSSFFNYFLEAGELRERLDRRLRQIDLARPEEISRLCAEMQDLVRGAEIPEDMAEELLDQARRLSGPPHPTKGVRKLAVRSSAVAEDGAAVSFAGQYVSVLDVHPEKTLEAYKRVLAGKYMPRAVTYRILHGITDAQAPMGALVLPMAEADKAGVLYTLDSVQNGRETAKVYAIPGLGDALVDGSISPQVTVMSRDAQPKLLGMVLGGDSPLLMPEEAGKLVRYGLRLEQLFGGPQDVEWAMDAEGGVTILQSRPFHEDGGPDGGLSGAEGEGSESLPPDPGDAERMVCGLERASAGAACGVTHHLLTRDGIKDIPDGAVVVSQYLMPCLARVVSRIRAVVSCSGSRASHFASVAREFGLPVLVGDEELEELLPEGIEVTVDARTGCVYRDRVEPLLADAAERVSAVADKLRPVMPLLTRLNLLDPESPEFSPEGCKSLHDMVRFVHEKGVAEMFSLVDKGGRGLARARKLATKLPLVMYVLDLGEGVFDFAKDKPEVDPDDIKCVPMWAFWWGLSDETVQWNENLTHVDWEEMDRMSAGIIGKDSKLLASYAVLSHTYMHVMIRFGYHFSVLDCLCDAEDKNNYISFRFKGGGGAYDQRLLRLSYLQKTLEWMDFEVSIKGDMLDARLGRMGEAVIQKRLASLGYLMASTRMMDMQMRGEEQVDELVQAFKARRQHLGG